MEKIIGIVGLGLIGGSMAKAIKKNTDYKVFGFDINNCTVKNAIEVGAIDGELKENKIGECDFIIVCLYPKDTVNYVLKNLEKVKSGAIIIDCVGVKENICNVLSKQCKEKGVYFVGGHPMAGIEKSGFDNSFSDLFKGATFILCKDEYTNIVALTASNMLFTNIGFSKITITSAKEHDKIIAFTSQMAHIVSNAYVKSETAKMQMGFSAGSYKDLTRVAYLNEQMWSQLFFDNKDNLIKETKGLIDRLKEYVEALENDDIENMKQLLRDGKKAKEMVG